MPLPPIDAVVFDLDGTLLDTIGDIARSMNAVLQRHGYPERPVDDYYARVGYGLEGLVRRLLPDRDDTTVGLLAREMTAEYRSTPIVATKPYDGIVPLVDALSRRGIQLAILSNKDDELVRRIVDMTLPPRFAHVQGQRPDQPPKPDPRSTLAIVGSMGATPERTAFVGDTEVDMQTARNAGCIAIGVGWGFRDAAAVAAAGAHQMCSTPAELAALLVEATAIAAGEG